MKFHTTKEKGQFVTIALHIILIILMATVLISAVSFQRDGPTIKGVSYVDNVQISIDGGPYKSIKLPYNVKNLSPRTPVTLKATVKPKLDDGVFIKTVYSPAKVYFDGRQVFEFGKKENYPEYMVDPATEIHIIEAYGKSREVELKIEYLSPVSRSTLAIHPPMVGTTKELIMERSRQLGVPFMFAISQMIAGFALILISLCVILVDKKGELFLWLGLFSLTTGAWAFGENNFTGIIFKGSAFLYILSFVGMFTFIVPLLRFTRIIIDFENPRPIWCLEIFFIISSAITIILQLTGTIAFSKSMYFFHIFLPPTLLALSIMTFYEYFKYKNINARRYMVPISILTLTAFLELFNYHYSFTYVFSSVFQMGIMLYLISMGIVAGLSFKDTLVLKEREKQLTFEKGLVDIQLKDQKTRSSLLAQHEQSLTQQRHDLRHHLRAISELVGDNEPVQSYIDKLIGNIPQKPKYYCENITVNAIISHFGGVCDSKGITLITNLIVPKTENDDSDDSLCAIFGNLLENAIEACDRMEEGEKFIKINSTLQYDLITITMDNSFNGKYQLEDGRFISSKRNDFGVGISSIQSIARKANGDAVFKTDKNIFYSSVYMKI